MSSPRGNLKAEEIEARVKTWKAKIQNLKDLEFRVRTLEDIEEIKRLQRACGCYLERIMVRVYTHGL
jgi:hypothetical protein